MWVTSAPAMRGEGDRTRAVRCGGPVTGTSSDHAEREHRRGDLGEPGDVGTQDVVAGATVLLRGVRAPGVDALHDLGEPLLGVGGRPGVAGRSEERRVGKERRARTTLTVSRRNT